MTHRSARSTVPALLGQYRVLLTILALVVAGVAVLAATPQGRAEIAGSVTREPEPFVAMYFADQPVRVRGPQLSVEFVVEQHEGGPTSYPYRIEVRDPSGAALVQLDGTAEPTPDAPARVSRDVALPAGSTWTIVDVTLPGRRESLNLRNPEPAPEPTPKGTS